MVWTEDKSLSKVGTNSIPSLAWFSKCKHMPNHEETLLIFGQIPLDSMTKSVQSQNPQWEELCNNMKNTGRVNSSFVGVSFSSHVNHKINSGQPEIICVARRNTPPNSSSPSLASLLLFLLSLQHKLNKSPARDPCFLKPSHGLPSLSEGSKLLKVAHRNCHLSHLAAHFLHLFVVCIHIKHTPTFVLAAVLPTFLLTQPCALVH